MTSATERFAEKTFRLIPAPKPVADQPGDVILTVTIIMLIVKLAIIVYECWKSHKAPETIVWRPNLLQRIYLRRVVRRVLKANGLASRTNDVMAALLKMASAASVEDIREVFEEAKADTGIWTSAKALNLV